MHELTHDVVVIGGGTAGSAAAIAAARRGHSVLLVEEQNCLGGVSTAGGVPGWFASVDGLGDVFESVKRELDAYGVQARRLYAPEYLKLVWQRLAEDAGVDILFHASLAGVEMRGDSVEAVRILSCSQTLTARASFFVDASGDGDLACLAGAEFQQGDPVDGRTLHMTLTFMLHDTGKPVTPYLPHGLEPIETADDLPGLHAHHGLPDGRIYCNMTKVIGHDPVDPVSLSHAEGEARNQLIRVLDYLQRNEYPTHALSWSGATIGIREGRRIVGDYVLSGAEIIDRTEPLSFDDGVAVATSQIDFHSLTKTGDAGWRQGVQPYNIPYRCLTGRGIANMLVAGRCIGTDQVVQSSCRMTPTCCAMGQAAGTAVALAIERDEADVRDIPMGQLREALASDGVELDPRKHERFAHHDTRLESDDLAPPEHVTLPTERTKH